MEFRIWALTNRTAT